MGSLALSGAKSRSNSFSVPLNELVAGTAKSWPLLGSLAGKSRLFYEFIHSHRAQGWFVLESFSVSYGKATTYLPVIDLLKTYFQIADRDETRTIRAKVTGHMLTLDEALRDTIPALLALLEALPKEDPFQSLDPSQRRRRTLDALKRLLPRESQVQPMLVVFENPLDRFRDAGLPQ